MAVIASIAVFAVAGAVGGYLFATAQQSLAVRDPKGAMACNSLRDWLDGKIKGGDGRPENQVIISGAVADLAKDSTTPTIREAAGVDLMADPTMRPLKDAGVSSLRFADLKGIHAACIAEGVDMPAYVVPR